MLPSIAVRDTKPFPAWIGNPGFGPLFSVFVYRMSLCSMTDALDYLFVSQRGVLTGHFGLNPRQRAEGADRQGVFFDGIGVFGNRLYLSGDAPPPQESGRGCYMTARRNPDGSTEIAADPLGLYPVFYFSEAGVCAVGNNLFKLVASLEGVGIKLRRSLTVHGYFCTQGSGAFDLTGYERIQLLPVGGRITISRNGTFRLSTPEPADLIYSDRPYAELRDETAHHIAGNVKALAGRSFDRYICDLTGGFDSRLVFAALQHCGVEQQFAYNTFGNYPNPDANVASLIRKTYALRKDVVIKGDVIQLPPLQRLRYTVGSVSGLLTMDHGGNPSVTKQNMVSVGGGLGELMRQFWAGVKPVMRQTEEKSWLLLPHELKEQITKLQEFRSRNMKAGVQWQHMGDLLYLKARARYHFGVWWKAALRGRNLFHPLYSPSGVKAVHALSDEDRKINRLGYDLMRAFSPELVSMPFADRSWHPSLHEPVAPVTSKTPFLGEKSAPRSASLPKSPPKPPKSAAQLRLPPGTMKRVIALGDLLDDFNSVPRDFDRLGNTFRIDAVKELLTTDAALIDTQKAWTTYRLLGAYIWAYDLEIASRAELDASLRQD